MSIFTRVAASVQSQFIIPYQQSHFSRTKYGKLLALYKGKFTGKRCFLIGNGPSLRAEDLTRLHEAGEITFAFNRIYNIFDQTPWRPSFYDAILGGYWCSIDVRNCADNWKWIHHELVLSALYGDRCHPLLERSRMYFDCSVFDVHDHVCAFCSD